MKRPIVYDLTHLVHRLAFEAPSGIDRVDLAYGRHFGLQKNKIVSAVHYAKTQPKVLPASRLAIAVHKLEDKWNENTLVEYDPVFGNVCSWLNGYSVDNLRHQRSFIKKATHNFSVGVLPLIRYVNLRNLFNNVIPQNAIYLNIAQHSLEHSVLFDWLTDRPDLQKVFFLHDLLPLDYPEFWWAGHEDIFERRMRVVFQHATALITSSKVVRDRVFVELAKRGKGKIPILTLPLPSPIESKNLDMFFQSELHTRPYFVIIGTIEPRKNHMLLLNIWRRLAMQGKNVPKLVIVGKRGWENQQIIGMLERCASISQHILEISGLSNSGLRRLICNARALLMPSFAEGYGLPIVEALSLGTPVIASDIPIFREVTQGYAIYLDPLDGLGWSEAIIDLCDDQSPRALWAKSAPKMFDAPTHTNYFVAVESFLADL